MPGIADKPLILASASETRAKMLTRAGVAIDIVPAAVDEEALKDSLLAEAAPPRDIADSLADAKARSVSFIHPDRMVLGADQILVQDGELFSKAANREAATATLRALSGKSHQLVSAAVIYSDGQPVWRGVASAIMSVRELSDDFINQYLEALGGDAFWSIGCYQLESLGAQLFNKIDGDYYTVLGLPLLAVLDFLRRQGMVAT